MGYKVGDLAKIFHVSPEMVRYYEKQGVIHSDRNLENNYRTYSIWDIYSFMEMLQYKEMGISAKEIVKFTGENYSQNLRTLLTNHYKDLEHRISYNRISAERVKELIDRTECYEWNENNYWVRKIPKQYLFHFISSKDDIYKPVDIDPVVGEEIFSERIVNFIDPIAEFGETQEWWYGISEKYADPIQLKQKGKARILEEQYYLCTIVNMGEIGEFSEKCIHSALEYMNQKKYKQNGQPLGVILGRGIEKEKLVRYMELRIPISLL